MKILNEEGNTSKIGIIKELTKHFHKILIIIKSDDKDTLFPSYEYTKRLKKNLTQYKNLKKEVQKLMKFIVVFLDNQAIIVILNLLFIRHITFSTQDLF